MNLFDAACQIASTLRKEGFVTYFAGGWVRDYLLGKPSSDIDIVTQANPEQIQAIFPHTHPIGIAFGIVMVNSQGYTFEVATFRKDREYLNGRHPVGIDKADPFEDAQRRDFTINGLFYDPETEEIIDYVNGQEDLKNRLIRAIGDPDLRFQEDRLRLLRAVRFAARFHFTIESTTRSAICRHASTLFPAVAVERVWQELTKSCQDGTFKSVMKEFHALSLLDQIFPGFPIENLNHFPSTLPSYTPTGLYLVPLLPTYSLDDWQQFAQKWKLSKKESQLMQLLAQALRTEPHPDPWPWAQLLRHPLFVEIAPLIALFNPEKPLFLHPHLYFLTPQDLLDLGWQPGPQLGQALQEAHAFAVRQEITSKELLLKECPFLYKK